VSGSKEPLQVKAIMNVYVGINEDHGVADSS
jgi:hypothetical protein